MLKEVRWSYFPQKRALQLNNELTELEEFSSDQALAWKGETASCLLDIMSSIRLVIVSV
jgi:hypothetical protein